MHIVRQHPKQAIRLRAFAGALRGACERDSISRLALAHREGAGKILGHQGVYSEG